MRTIGAAFEDNQHSTATPTPCPPPTADLKLKLNEEIIFLAISSLKCILKSMICVIVLLVATIFNSLP